MNKKRKLNRIVKHHLGYQVRQNGKVFEVTAGKKPKANDFTNIESAIDYINQKLVK